MKLQSRHKRGQLARKRHSAGISASSAAAVSLNVNRLGFGSHVAALAALALVGLRK